MERMTLAIKIILLLLVSGAIVSGQALLSIYVRNLRLPFNLGEALVYTATSGPFYAFMLFYGAGILGYLVLLRTYTLAEINLSLMVIIIAMTLGYGYVLGQSLTTLQWIGAVLATIGLVAMNSR